MRRPGKLATQCAQVWQHPAADLLGPRRLWLQTSRTEGTQGQVAWPRLVSFDSSKRATCGVDAAMRFWRLRRRLAVFVLAGVAFVVLLQHFIYLSSHDTSQIPFAVPGRRHYERRAENFTRLPGGFLGRTTRAPFATTTARNETAKTEHDRNSQLEKKRGAGKPSLWPLPFDNSDRILEQLEYQLDRSAKRKTKMIFTLDTSLYFNNRLKQDKCAVQDCMFVHRPAQMATADVVVFTGSYPVEPSTATRTRTDQIWVSFMLEAPPNSPIFTPSNRHINWTATYRTDSTIVAPYERFVQFANVTKFPEKPPRNFALGKTKKAAWFVSNCRAGNGRSQYVKELQKYIEVDIYGGCGPLQCRRNDAASCFQLLNKDYKFYMSFENSNCKDYITEKLYWNAL